MKNKIQQAFVMVMVALLLPSLAMASIDDNDKPLFSLTPWGGATFLSDDIGLKNGGVFGGRVAIHLMRFMSVEAGLGWSYTEFTADNSSADLMHEGYDLVLDLFPGSNVNPYILGGFSRLNIDRGGQTSSWKKRGWEAGCGLKWRVGGDNVNRRDLRLEVRDVMYDLTAGTIPAIDDVNHNLIVSAALQFHFGRGSKDTDKDGVRNQEDTCDNTPTGAIVDLSGCPVDTDGDGVYDGLDSCQDTPSGASVDASGCPMDADGDGVFDGLDQCPDTPAGARVDASGCPIDSDNDGVFDGLDECADTHVDAVIDPRGCPIDSDGDGVYDGLDQCPTTPSHLFVDDHGCPIEVSETFEQLLDTGMIRTSDVRFRSGSSDLNTNDTDKLDEIGRTLSHWPELNIEVSGHTDSQGSEAGNNKLSTARAQAVTDYLVTKFPKIQSQQFIVLGHGESNPIADNSTFEGRATNRRVEFKVLNTDVIKRVHERRKMMER